MNQKKKANKTNKSSLRKKEPLKFNLNSIKQLNCICLTESK